MIQELIKFLKENKLSLVIEFGETLIGSIGFDDYSYSYCCDGKNNLVEIMVNTSISAMSFLITGLNLRHVRKTGHAIIIELY